MLFLTNFCQSVVVEMPAIMKTLDCEQEVGIKNCFFL